VLINFLAAEINLYNVDTAQRVAVMKIKDIASFNEKEINEIVVKGVGL
jgi:hypothetical protein